MIAEFPAFVAWALAGLIALYIVVRIVSGRLHVWDKADTLEDAKYFRLAIFGYKPIWFAYAAWLAIAVATLLTINHDGALTYLPIIFVITYQLWKLRTPRDYRGVVGKVMCVTLPITLGFYCFAYPVRNPLVFALLLAWIVASMLMQVFTLKAIAKYDDAAQKRRYEIFDRQNVFGEAGRGLTSSGLDAGNVEVGLLGEKKTAAVLNHIASENKELYIFHSVAWLSDSTYDIDHVMYYKGNVVFLDSKFWGAGKHEINKNNFVFRNGVNREMELHLPTALEQYSDRVRSFSMPLNKTDVWVAVQGHNDADVVIGSHDSSDSIMLVAGADLDAQVQNWISLVDSKGWARYTDQRVLDLFRTRLK
jgi:hypothetical protein